MISINPNPSEEDSGSCYKLNFGALIKQSNSHKRAVLDYLRKVHFKPCCSYSHCNRYGCEASNMSFIDCQFLSRRSHPIHSLLASLRGRPYFSNATSCSSEISRFGLFSSPVCCSFTGDSSLPLISSPNGGSV